MLRHYRSDFGNPIIRLTLTVSLCRFTLGSVRSAIAKFRGRQYDRFSITLACTWRSTGNRNRLTRKELALLAGQPPPSPRTPHPPRQEVLALNNPEKLDASREPLKGRVDVSRTLNLGNFNSRKVELSQEFWTDISTHEEEYVKLQAKLDRLTGRGDV